MAWFKKGTIKSDLYSAYKGAAMLTPMGYTYYTGKNTYERASGQKTRGEFHQTNVSNAKLGAAVGVAGLVVTTPGVVGGAYRLYQTAMKTEAGLHYNAIDYFNDLKGEYQRNDLEAKDFLFYLLPELVQYPMKRYTYWDVPPEKLVQIMGPAYEEAERKMIAAGVPIKKKKSSSKKSPSKRKKCPAGYYWNRKQQKCLKSKF